jgi:hypothetical protein
VLRDDQQAGYCFPRPVSPTCWLGLAPEWNRGRYREPCELRSPSGSLKHWGYCGTNRGPSPERRPRMCTTPSASALTWVISAVRRIDPAGTIVS